MAAGSEVVEDYVHAGLSLRDHPAAFPRGEFRWHGMVACAEAMMSGEKRWIEVAWLVFFRQRPGSAEGVMFITMEDETGVANLVAWKKTFKANRLVVLGAGMLGVRGRIQREGEVVHIVAHTMTNLSQEVASVGRRDEQEREAPTPRDRVEASPTSQPTKVRDTSIPDLTLDAIRVKTRDFR